MDNFSVSVPLGRLKQRRAGGIFPHAQRRPSTRVLRLNLNETSVRLFKFANAGHLTARSRFLKRGMQVFDTERKQSGNACCADACLLGVRCAGVPALAAPGVDSELCRQKMRCI